MFILILIFLTACAICAAFFGNYIGRKGVMFTLVGGVFLALLCDLWLVYSNFGVILKSNFGTWISLGWFSVGLSFTVDSLAMLFITVVLFISFLVHLFSVFYMCDDAHVIRFFVYITLFTVFMLVLVTGENLLVLFVGWEGVGICSYLLITFWFNRVAANKAAIKAMLFNRIGDFGIFLSLWVLFYTYGSFSIDVISACSILMSNVYVYTCGHWIALNSLLSCLWFVSVCGKSAQISLHVWLADAMEGPTPVSALIHAATMVTAGIYSLIRMSFVLEFTRDTLVYVCFVGGISAFFGASVAIFQNDLKRIIAFSTCSQLGFLVLACGCSLYNLSLFHLINHACFKACLFLAAGVVIHSLGDRQDIRDFGNLFNRPTIFFFAIVVSGLSMCGFPFLSGSFSKDLILSSIFSKYVFVKYAYIAGKITAICTVLYTFRLFFYLFAGANASVKFEDINGDPISNVVLLILGFCGIISGVLLRQFFVFNVVLHDSYFVAIQNYKWNSAWFGSLSVLKGASYHTLVSSQLDYKILLSGVSPVFVCFAVVFLCKVYYAVIVNFQLNFMIDVYCAASFKKNIYNRVVLFFINGWYIDFIYNVFVFGLFYKFVRFLCKIVECGWLEIIGPTGISSLFIVVNNFGKSMLTFNIRDLLIEIYFGLVCLLVVVLFII